MSIMLNIENQTVNFRHFVLLSTKINVVYYKKGAVILVGGGDGHIDKAYHTACTLLHHMKCFNIHDAVYSHNTNERPAIDDKIVLSGLNNILDFFEIEK